MILAAFVRALRDPFPPARTAGIVAMSQAASYYQPTEMATRVIPAIAPLTLDPEKDVRDKVGREKIRIFKNEIKCSAGFSSDSFVSVRTPILFGSS